MKLVLVQNVRGRYYFPENCPKECKNWTIPARMAYAEWLPSVAKRFEGKLHEAYTYLQDSLAKGKYPVLDIGQSQYLFYPKIKSPCQEAVSEYIYTFSERTAKVQIQSFELENVFWQIQPIDIGCETIKEEVVCGIPDEYGYITFRPYKEVKWLNEEDYQKSRVYIAKWAKWKRDIANADRPHYAIPF